MQFATLLLAATACAVASAAKFGMTGSQFVGVTAGSTFNISWYDGSGSISIILKNGESNALKTVSTIQSGLTGTTGSYAWSIPSTLPTDTYALEIDDSTGTPNYSVQFKITGGPAVSSTATSASSSLATSATSSRASSATSSTASTTSSSNSTASVTSGSSTATSGTQTSSSTSTRTSASASSTSTIAAVNSAAGIASPLAFVLLAFAAIATLN